MREFILHHPGGTNLPLIFGFHGKFQTPEGFADQSKLHMYANCSVIYPKGTWLNWDGDADSGQDMSAIDEILNWMMANCWTNVDKVYAFGLSNGGRFSWSLASDWDKLAGWVSVGGALTDMTLHPSKPIPGIVISGTKDKIAPWNGGGSGSEGVDFPSSLQRWENANGGPVTIYRPNQGHVWTVENTYTVLEVFGLK